MTTMTTDLYCPNCQKPVRPKEQRGWQTWVIGIAMCAAVGILIRLAFGTGPGFIGLAVGIFVARYYAPRYKRRSCPICRTYNLQQQG